MSAQITVAQPRASTAGSRFTIAFLGKTRSHAYVATTRCWNVSQAAMLAAACLSRTSETSGYNRQREKCTEAYMLPLVVPRPSHHGHNAHIHTSTQSRGKAAVLCAPTVFRWGGFGRNMIKDSPLCHPHDAQGERHRYTDRQALRDSSHGQRHPDVEHLQQLLTLRDQEQAMLVGRGAVSVLWQPRYQLVVSSGDASDMYPELADMEPLTQYPAYRGHHWRVRHATPIQQSKERPPESRQRER